MSQQPVPICGKDRIPKGNRSLPSLFLCHCEPIFGSASTTCAAIPKLHDRGLLRAAAPRNDTQGVNGYATFEYTDDEVSVRVPNVYAWVCPVDGEASFTPETVDELIETVRELIETAKRARRRRSILTEYVVSVGV